MDPDRRASLRRRLDLDEGLLSEKTKDVLLSMLDELIEEGTLPMLLDKLKDASGKDGIDYDNILGLIGELNDNGLLKPYADTLWSTHDQSQFQHEYDLATHTVESAVTLWIMEETSYCS